MSSPLSPPIVKGPCGKALPAYVANGVIGLRVRDNPLAAGMALVCGYSGRHPQKKIEAAAVAPYPLAGNVCLDGVWLSDVPHQLTVIDQAYDFSNGELLSHVRFVAQDVIADIEILTFCCRHQPTLVVQEVTIVCDRACNVKLQALVDSAGIHGQLKSRSMKTPGGGEQDFDGSLLWESEGCFSTCGLALATELRGTDATVEAPAGGDRSPLVAQYGFRARAGKSYRLIQVASMVPSVMHSQPDRQAERLVAFGMHQGFEKLRAANRAEWKDLWKGRILLHGAERRWQQLADSAFYYFNASVHAGAPASTSMFGLATWHDYHYYYGHVMWDIETFSIPPLNLMQPEAARAMLDYRVRSLLGARRNAQCYGRRGLQFPWEAAPTTGEEATPSPGTSAWHEDHISPDVALAFVQHAQTTGDGNFLRDKAWPVLSGVADWIVSRAHKSREGWEIRRCMGIAERKQECDNEAFTMLSARAALEAALETAAQLNRPEGNQWRAIAEHLKLPLRGDIMVSHDDFRVNEEKGATPSPLMGVFPLDNLDADVARATLDFYLPLAKHYIGSPMLSSLYGVWAARAGDRALSLKLLDEGYRQFSTGRFQQILEYRPDKFPEQPQAGPFFANMGGFLTSLLYGFPGLKPGWDRAENWTRQDVVLPEGWEAIEMERLWLKGKPKRLIAEHGKRSRLMPA